MAGANSQPTPRPLVGRGVEEFKSFASFDQQGSRAGFVNLVRLISLQGKLVRYPDPSCLLGSSLRTRDLGPTLESIPHLLTVYGRRQ
jgi:hypothetical protein